MTTIQKIDPRKIFVSVEQAAKIVKCTPGRIRQLLRAKKILGEKIGERNWLVYRDSAKETAKTKHTSGRPRTGKTSDYRS